MNEALINGIFVLAGTILGSLISLFATMYSNNVGMKRSIQLSNRDKVMELSVELSRLLAPFKNHSEFDFVREAGVASATVDSLNASIAINKFWNDKRGELEIFLPDQIINLLNIFVFNTFTFVDTSQNYPETSFYVDTISELNKLSGNLLTEIKKSLNVI